MKNGNKRDLKIKLLIRLGFKLGFFPVFIFPFAVFVSHSPFSAIIRPETQSKSVLKTKHNPLLNDLLFVLLLLSECPLRKYFIMCHTLYVTVFIVVKGPITNELRFTIKINDKMQCFPPILPHAA